MKLQALLLGVLLHASVVTASSEPQIVPAMHPVVAGPDFVVVPVPLLEIPGAFGSRWTAELWAYNGWAAPVFIQPGPCRVDLPECRTTVGPGAAMRIPPPADPVMFAYTITTPGTDEHMPDFSRVQFSLRVRDLSRSAESAGTEIPVLRDRDFVNQPIQLLNVPTDPRFRTMLRVLLQPLRPESQRLSIRIFAMDSPGAPLAEREVLLQPVIMPAIYGGYPVPLAMLPDLTTGLPAEITRVRIEIAPKGSAVSRFYGFVTITNNETQQVTTVTPQ